MYTFLRKYQSRFKRTELNVDKTFAVWVFRHETTLSINIMLSVRFCIRFVVRTSNR